jgi:hypothetical protein
MDRPIYIGFSVLELSKWKMYSFHYDHMKRKYPQDGQLTLLYMDTDSFMYEFCTDNLYEDMHEDLDRYYDTSDYPSDHPNFSNKNKKVLGKWKDELNGTPIQEIVALKAKMYSVMTPTQVKKVAKGIHRVFLNKHLTHADYKQCLNEGRSQHAKASTIRSVDHKLYTMTVNKKGLDCNDSKRVVLSNNHNTLPFGHYRLQDPDWCGENLMHRHQPLPLDVDELFSDESDL